LVGCYPLEEAISIQYLTSRFSLWVRAVIHFPSQPAVFYLSVEQSGFVWRSTDGQHTFADWVTNSSKLYGSSVICAYDGVLKAICAIRVPP
jgi:hypothetical protein